jgi:gluconate 2-dehydrogenase
MAVLVEQGRWVRSLDETQYGWDVGGKTVGIVGYGRIGRAVAHRAAMGFNMPVLYHARRPADSGLPADKARQVSFDAVLGESDFIVVMTPLNDQTRGLIGAREFGLMKSSAILVNAARGPIVQESALLEALDGGRLRAAALDVFDVEPLPADSRLRGHPRVLALPHMGSATHETREAMANLAVSNLLCVLRGEPALTPYSS